MGKNTKSIALIVIIGVAILALGYFVFRAPVPQTATPTAPTGVQPTPPPVSPTQPPSLPPQLSPEDKEKIEEALKEAEVTNTLRLVDCNPNPKIPRIAIGQDLTVINDSTREIHFSIAGQFQFIPPSKKMVIGSEVFNRIGVGLHGYTCALPEDLLPGREPNYRLGVVLFL